MTRRRTCCCGGGEGDVCFKFAVNAKYLQYCTLACTAVPCVVYRDETCPVVDSFGVINVYTRALGTLQPQQFVTSRLDNLCSCGTPCVYTWTPFETSWDTSVCFKMNGLGSQCFGCPEIIDQNPPPGGTGSITVLLGGPLTCPQVCGCCGTGTRFVSIEYTRSIPTTVVQGACGPANVGNNITGIWTTTYTVQYCWNVSNPCTMTLFRIFAGGDAYFFPSLGPDAYTGSECDCGTNSSNGCDTTTTGSNCYPFTGDWATIYVAAGSPPVTLNCGSCKC